ncbi:MAG: Calcium-gated potassium channel mthK [Marmoricola sp.]|nr:Calcium-gated potassium channel mthK [Marmoricola sp.]
MTSDDLVNIETGLAVRDLLEDRWLEVPVVLRVFDRRLAGTVSGSFDFRNVRSPAALAAPWFVGAALGMDVLQTLYVGGLPMLVARLSVGEALAGTEMRDLSARLRVVCLARGDGSVVNLPRRETAFAAGDVATLVGPYEELLLLLRRTVADSSGRPGRP